MTVTLNLPQQVEQAYLAEAQARGVPVEEVMQETLVTARRSSSVDAERLSPEEWMRAFKAWAHSHDHENLPVLSDEAIRRGSMYG